MRRAQRQALGLRRLRGGRTRLLKPYREAAGARGQLGSVASVRMQLPFLLLGCSVRERTPLLLLQQEFDNAFLFLSLPAVAYAVCAVAATDGGAGKADTVDWHPNSSNKMLALPGLLCYYPGCVYQSWLALQLFGRFMSFPPQAPRMPANHPFCRWSVRSVCYGVLWVERLGNRESSSELMCSFR